MSCDGIEYHFKGQISEFNTLIVCFHDASLLMNFYSILYNGYGYIEIKFVSVFYIIKSIWIFITFTF